MVDGIVGKKSKTYDYTLLLVVKFHLRPRLLFVDSVSLTRDFKFEESTKGSPRFMSRNVKKIFETDNFDKR